MSVICKYIIAGREFKSHNTMWRNLEACVCGDESDPAMPHTLELFVKLEVIMVIVELEESCVSCIILFWGMLICLTFVVEYHSQQF